MQDLPGQTGAGAVVVRHMSFALTTRQMQEKTKTVTRRKGWLFLKVGDRLQAVVQGQGLQKGEKVKKLGVIEITAVRREALSDITREDVIAEGFGAGLVWSGEQFVEMYRAANGGPAHQPVTRIEFRHL